MHASSSRLARHIGHISAGSYNLTRLSVARLEQVCQRFPSLRKLRVFLSLGREQGRPDSLPLPPHLTLLEIDTDSQRTMMQNDCQMPDVLHSVARLTDLQTLILPCMPPDSSLATLRELTHLTALEVPIYRPRAEQLLSASTRPS